MTAPVPPSSAHDPAALLLGEYALGARLDRRASADVYEATHVPTGGARLVYVLHAAAAQDNPLVHQVVCEIDAARWLRHAAIAKVDGHGETPTGTPYVAVARAAGRPLGEALASGALRGRRRFVRLANRLVEALDEAHQVGLVHGRLTPASIVVGDTADDLGTPPLTILGFGVAALAHDGPVPPAGRVYVAPEVLAGGTPDERSDVFALASVLHHLLVGAAPGAPGPAAAGSAPTPTDHAAALAVLAGARAADAAHRPRSVKAFWEELMAALVDDAAAPAPAAARTSGETAVRTVLEQLEHERRQAPRVEAKATLLSPMPAAPIDALTMDLVAAPDASVARPATTDASAALAALAAFAPSPPPVPAALAPARPSMAVPAPTADASAPAAPASSAVRPSHPDGVPRTTAPERPARAERVDRVERAERIERADRAERAELARADERDAQLADLPPSRAIGAGLPARYRARPGFLLAAGIGATVALLAIVNWPVATDAAPVVDPDPPAVIAIRAAMAVDAAKDRRARQALSGRRAAGASTGADDLDVVPGDSADSVFVAPLPAVAPIVIPTVRGIDVPTVRASGASAVGAGDFRRLRRATVDTLP